MRAAGGIFVAKAITRTTDSGICIFPAFRGALSSAFITDQWQVMRRCTLSIFMYHYGKIKQHNGNFRCSL